MVYWYVPGIAFLSERNLLGIALIAFSLLSKLFETRDNSDLVYIDAAAFPTASSQDTV